MSIHPFRKVVSRSSVPTDGRRVDHLLTLECGHEVLVSRAERFVRHRRCRECQPVPSRGRPQPSGKVSLTGSMLDRIVALACAAQGSGTADERRQARRLVEWAEQLQARRRAEKRRIYIRSTNKGGSDVLRKQNAE
jgi:hypothetical protein